MICLQPVRLKLVPFVDVTGAASGWTQTRVIRSHGSRLDDHVARVDLLKRQFRQFLRISLRTRPTEYSGVGRLHTAVTITVAASLRESCSHLDCGAITVRSHCLRCRRTNETRPTRPLLPPTQKERLAASAWFNSNTVRKGKQIAQ